MAKLFANSRDPDQTPHSAASDLGLHCLPITLLRVSRLQWVQFHVTIIVFVKLCHSLGKFSRQQLNDIFLIFPLKIVFDILCILSHVETICMKCHPDFWQSKKNISECQLLKFFPAC